VTQIEVTVHKAVEAGVNVRSEFAELFDDIFDSEFNAAKTD
jgi:hypothetical protein